MRYSLGSFPIDRSAACVAAMERGARHPRRVTGAWIRELLAENWNKPDLLVELPPDHPPRGWLGAVHDAALAYNAAGGQLVLAECLCEAGLHGEAAVVMFDRSQTAKVRVGDEHHAGVAFVATPTTGLLAMPRVVRKLCSNGSVLKLPSRAAAAIEVAEVPQALAACLAPASFGAFVARLQEASEFPVGELEVLIDRLDIDVPPDELELVMRGDRSLYGLFNALTSLAQDEPRWSARLRREADAVGCLDLLDGRWAPRRSGRAAAVLV